MEFYLDSADIKTIQYYINHYNIKGITCNPTILIKDHGTIQSVIDAVPSDKDLYFEVIATEHNKIIAETKYLMSLSNNIHVKIPATPEGFIAIRLLRKEGIKTLATAIYSFQQAMMAAYNGASEIAPYVNRMNNLGNNGLEITEHIHQVFKEQHVDCKIIGASFKSVYQVNYLLTHGIESVTMGADVFEKYLTDQNGIDAANAFKAAWKNAYDTEELLVK